MKLFVPMFVVDKYVSGFYHVLGNAAFDFTCLLHTYFRVPDVTRAAVSNLCGCTFTDKVTFSALL